MVSAKFAQNRSARYYKDVMDTELLHPTKVRLIDTVSTMLDGQSPYDILIENVLRESEVSRGSLYYHFGDFQSVIEQTLITRFSRGVDETTAMVREAADLATSQEDFWQRMYELTLRSQSPELAPRRAERARVIGMAGSNERFGVMLAAEQDRLNADFAAVISEVQAKGWARANISPHAIALFVQAYTLGRSLDDVANNKIDPREWNDLITLVTSTLHS